MPKIKIISQDRAKAENVVKTPRIKSRTDLNFKLKNYTTIIAFFSYIFLLIIVKSIRLTVNYLYINKIKSMLKVT